MSRTMRFPHLIRSGIAVVGLVWIVAMLPGCAGSPEATAQWYLSDKPSDMRVPVSGQTDPAQATIPALDE